MRVAVLLLALVLGEVATTPLLFQKPIKHKDPKLDTCKLCIQFSEQFINQLLNIVLNVGVVGSCADLCGILANKTNNDIAGVVCNLLCDVVGIKEFINVINKADLDPIYYCELLKTCPIKDDGDANITSFTVTPKSGPQGTKFEIDMTFETVNGTGTGEIIIEILAADGLPLSQSLLMEPLDAGSYPVSMKVKAAPDPDCDPTQGPCEMWVPGLYKVKSLVCNGQCGSEHPHSKIYDEAATSFNLTRSAV